MQYTTLLLGLLATTATTTPTKSQQSSQTKRFPLEQKRDDGPLKVTLETDFFNNAAADFFGGVAAELLATNLGEADAKAPAFPGPYATFTLDTGSGNPAARCQLTDADGQPVTLIRGANVDTTFGDGGNGPWRMQNGGTFTVGEIKCDPAFVSANSK
ncbi:hypothetical protein PG999_002723 [Apiospora kogelbergensis]|uniref:Uncharacterized protein n=1 Tax=Apiospora kogelbergensis TaxID=1337665 RepID=A0AAW0R967_9PEZI